LINKGDHWVLAVGFTTDVKPTTSAAAHIQEIGIFNSLKPHGNFYETYTLQRWLSDPWNGSIRWPRGANNRGRWKNHWAAVIQKYRASSSGGAPTPRLKIDDRSLEEPAKARDTPLITSSEAKKRALEWFRSSRYVAGKSFFDAKAIQPVKPMRVRSLSGGGQSYFLVPIADQEKDAPVVSILVGASSDEVEQATQLLFQLQYLTKSQAVRIVRDAVGSSRSNERWVAELVYRPCKISQSAALPFWRVQTANRAYYVSQSRELFRVLAEQKHGGA
jgi:hypothetical protein